MDAVASVPRSPLAEVGGYPWLPRLIDKVRAEAAGRTGPYTPYPGGIDSQFIEVLGVDAQALGDVIRGGAADEEVAAWVRAHQSPAAAGRLERFRAGLRAPVPARYAEELAEEIAQISAARPELDFSGVRSFVHVLCVEEGHPFPD